MRSGVGASVGIAQGQDVGEALVQAGRGIVAGTIGGVAANKIAVLKDAQEIDLVTHKILHGLLGGVVGSVLSDGPLKGAAAGAVGAIAAETIAEVVSEDMEPLTQKIQRRAAKEGRPLTEATFKAEYQQELERSAEWGKLGGGVATLLAGQDVNVGIAAATNAIDNNFLVLAYYGAVAASVAWSGYEVIDTYQTQGTEAALKKLGIEIITNAAGAGVGRFAGKVVYKFGKHYSSNMIEIVNAALADRPAFKLVLSKFITKLSTLGEKASASQIGQAVAKVESKILAAEDKVVGAVKGKLSRWEPSHSSGSSGSGHRLPMASNAQWKELKDAKLIGEYNFYKSTEGPLSEKLAKSFMGAKYKTYELNSDAIIYRATEKSNSSGRGEFFSFQKPVHELQTRIDKAIKPVWGERPYVGNESLSFVEVGYAFKVPKGTCVHVGEIAPQGDLLLGGTEQVIIELKYFESLQMLERFEIGSNGLWRKMKILK